MGSSCAFSYERLSGCRVWGLEFRVRGFEFRVQGLCFRVRGLRFRVQSRTLNLRQELGCRVSGLGVGRLSYSMTSKGNFES